MIGAVSFEPINHSYRQGFERQSFEGSGKSLSSLTSSNANVRQTSTSITSSAVNGLKTVFVDAPVAAYTKVTTIGKNMWNDASFVNAKLQLVENSKKVAKTTATASAAAFNFLFPREGISTRLAGVAGIGGTTYGMSELVKHIKHNPKVIPYQKFAGVTALAVLTAVLLDRGFGTKRD